MGFKKTTFGLMPSSARGGGNSRGRGGGGGGGGGRGGFQKRGGKPYRAPGEQAAAFVPTGDEGTHVEQRFDDAAMQDEIDRKMGFFKFQEGPEKLGWLINQHAVRMKNEELNMEGTRRYYYLLHVSFPLTLLFACFLFFFRPSFKTTIGPLEDRPWITILFRTMETCSKSPSSTARTSSLPPR